MGYVRLQPQPFSIDAVLAELAMASAGGVTFYVGSVRGDDDGRPIEALTYESYPEMAQAQLERIRQDVIDRYGLVDAICIHRLGRLAAGEPILLVALAGRHRKETFAAIDDFMDQLKQRVPIWKQEASGGAQTWIVGAEGRRVPR